MKKRKIIIIGIVSLLFAVLAFHAPSAEAKKKTPAFNKKSISLKKGNRTKITIKNASPKKVKWTVNKAGKSVITLSAKKKKSITVSGKKAGTATVTAKLTLKGKKTKSLKAKVKVSGKAAEKKADASKTDNPDVPEKESVAFPGSIKASLTDAGYVKLQWTWVSDAEFYVLQRKTGTGSWDELKNTAAIACTDKTVAENTQYQYRVKAEYKGMKTTAFSSPVVIQTGKMKNNNSEMTDSNPTPEPTVKPDPEPTEKPEDKTYKAKYSYEVEVLNQFNLYQDEYVVLYIKTDNPDPKEDVFWTESDDFGFLPVYCETYEDINYVDPSENIQSTRHRKVKGGYIETIVCSSAGKGTINLKEGISDDECATVASFQVEVLNREKGLKDYCNGIINTVSDDAYDEDGLGKWSTLSGQQRMERLEEYVKSHMHYPRIGGTSIFGGNTIVPYIQENVGAYWETGFADCMRSNEMMCVLAEILGYTAHLHDTTLNGGPHTVAMVTIDGEEIKYDATPWQGGYGDWDYLL